MNRRILTTIFAILAIFQVTFAQHRNCHSHHYLEDQKAKNPQRAIRMQQIENHLQKFIEKQEDGAEMAQIYTIPVVVHVIYETAAQNISLAQIQSQLDVLNQDFRRTNPDANGTWPQAADSEIEFCLATVDPNGNATSGITRTQTSAAPFGTNDNMKFNSSGGHDIWDRNNYLNMWVCQLSGGILGYAQFPGGPAATDGVVMDYRYFGTVGTATAPFDKGRTTTHEVGHWLNLYHIWGDGNCNQDDGVADTPSSDAPNYGCATGHTSCGSVDMVENYMDYSDDGCMNLFTAGQSTRMRALFSNGGARASLLNSTACGSTPPPPSCATPSGLAANNVTSSGATASWSAVSGANNYNLDYRSVGGSWTTQTVAGTSATLSGLSNCTNYEIRVRANCATGSSNYSSLVAFQTTGCSSGCNDNELTLTIITDDYGNETTWEVTSGSTVLYSGGPYSNNSTEVISLCLPDGCYDFTIFDSYGDGICCAYGNGSYQVTDDAGQVLISGGQFGSQETQQFCAGNGGGGGGGGCTSAVLDFNNFDSGWGIWNDGGSDCRRSANDAAYANSGSRCVRLRDNTNTSVMTTDNLNLSNVEEITVDFTYIARSMDNSNEDFWFQISTNGGSTYTTVEEWNRGDEFENNIREFDAVTVSGPFSSNTRLRFRCDASGNSDWVYIDDVEISGCVSNNTKVNLVNDTPAVTSEDVEIDFEEEYTEDIELKVFPNPVSDQLTIEYSVAGTNDAQLIITDFTGKVMRQIEIPSDNDQFKLNVTQFTPGYYLVHLVNRNERMSQKFVVVR